MKIDLLFGFDLQLFGAFSEIQSKSSFSLVELDIVQQCGVNVDFNAPIGRVSQLLLNCVPVA